MRIEDALPILQALSDGLDPSTGEALPAHSVCQNPRTVRALCCAIRALELEKKQERIQQLPANAGRAWSGDEDQRISEEFRNGADVRTIAKNHCRTRGAIVSRLAKLGLMPATYRRR